MKKTIFELCPTCNFIEEGDLLETSSSEFSFCSKCHRYAVAPEENWALIEIDALFLDSDPCDCIARHGRVMHWNGGNYHRTVWVALESWDRWG
jgi:hypothetical protein